MSVPIDSLNPHFKELLAINDSTHGHKLVNYVHLGIIGLWALSGYWMYSHDNEKQTAFGVTKNGPEFYKKLRHVFNNCQAKPI